MALWLVLQPLWWCFVVALLFGSLYSPMYPILRPTRRTTMAP